MPTQVKCEKCQHTTVFDDHTPATICHMCGHIYGSEIKTESVIEDVLIPEIILDDEPESLIEEMTDFTESDEVLTDDEQ